MNEIKMRSKHEIEEEKRKKLETHQASQNFVPEFNLFPIHGPDNIFYPQNENCEYKENHRNKPKKSKKILGNVPPEVQKFVPPEVRKDVPKQVPKTNSLCCQIVGMKGEKYYNQQCKKIYDELFCKENPKKDIDDFLSRIKLINYKERDPNKWPRINDKKYYINIILNNYETQYSLLNENFYKIENVFDLYFVNEIKFPSKIDIQKLYIIWIDVFKLCVASSCISIFREEIYIPENLKKWLIDRNRIEYSERLKDYDENYFNNLACNDTFNQYNRIYYSWIKDEFSMFVDIYKQTVSLVEQGYGEEAKINLYIAWDSIMNLVINCTSYDINRIFINNQFPIDYIYLSPKIYKKMI